MADILIVEDDALVAEILWESLQNEGHRLRHASSGGAALDALAYHLPDLVITDYAMPGMRGDELVERIRTTDAWRALPVILISGLPDAEGATFHLGIDGFLGKPFDELTLLRLVDDALRPHEADPVPALAEAD